MSILAEKAAAFRQRIVDALLPQDCLLCSAPSGSGLLCCPCAREMPRLDAPRCPRCALPGTGGDACGRCQRRPPHFDAAVALYPYRFPVDALVQRLKYGHDLAVAAHFGAELAAACQPLAPTLIVPMPLHASRLAERGFNQAAEIARPVAARLGVPLAATSCRRQRATAAQEGLSPAARHRNVRRAFACDTDLCGHHVLLVDDVATTGASADECARILRLHGAGRVTLAVVARTLLD